jgi:hypothetical protein
VQGEWDAPPPDDLAHDLEVALGVLLFAEASRQHLTGGVVDGSDQTQVGSPPFQPVVPAGVDLHEHARLGIAVTPASVPRRSPLTWRRDAGGGQDAMDAGPGYRQPVLLDQKLGQVLLVETGIGRGRQLHHLARQLRVECVHRTATTIAPSSAAADARRGRAAGRLRR